MAEYLLSVHGAHTDTEVGGYASREEAEKAFADTGRFNQALIDDGYWVFAGGLEPHTTAKVVDGQAGTPVVTDGPYLESKEFLGGFWVIDVPDEATALRLAAEGSKACRQKVEVRPFHGVAG